MKLKTINDYKMKGKKVIIRCDFNVPMEDGKITDNTKIKESLETIQYAISSQAKVILMSHLGRVKTGNDKKDNSLYQVSIELSNMLNKKVKFISVTRGPILEEAINNLEDGEVILIENTRFEDIDEKKESSCDEELSKYWASLADIFINDAYGTCHRTHASNVGIASNLPNGIGFLVEKEISKIDSILNEGTHPYIIVMGGKKVSDKIKIIENLITKCDKLIIGGAMAYTFLKSNGYDVTNNIIDEESIQFCQNILKKYSSKIVLPVDIVDENGNNININNLSGEVGYDIGTQTIKLFIENLKFAKRVIINGPMGMFENKQFATGTYKLYEYLVNNNIKTIIGGGDTAASANELGFSNGFYHISTGGGATLEYLEGKPLPGISVINHE